jgi:hypothetical protein
MVKLFSGFAGARCRPVDLIKERKERLIDDRFPFHPFTGT